MMSVPVRNTIDKKMHDWKFGKNDDGNDPFIHGLVGSQTAMHPEREKDKKTEREKKTEKDRSMEKAFPIIHQLGKC